MAFNTTAGFANFTRERVGLGLWLIRIEWRDANADGLVVQPFPWNLSGAFVRYHTLMTGSGPVWITIRDVWDSDVLTNLFQSVVTGSGKAGHLQAALSTRGALSCLCDGPLLLRVVVGVGDEAGVTDFWFIETLDVDIPGRDGVALARCRVETRNYAWVSNAAGTANIYLDDVQYPRLNGIIARVATLPDPADAPTTLYDIVIRDEYGYDIADNLLANRSATASEAVYLWHVGAVASQLQRAVQPGGISEIRITNAGASKKGTIALYILVPSNERRGGLMI